MADTGSGFKIKPRPSDQDPAARNGSAGIGRRDLAGTLARAAEAAGTVRSGAPRGGGGERVLPRRAGGRGRRGGGVVGVGVPSFSRNRSPESTEAAAGRCRGCTRRPGARERAKTCQNGAQRRERGRGREEMARGCRNSPETELVGGGKWRDGELSCRQPKGSRVEWLGANGR